MNKLSELVLILLEKHCWRDKRNLLHLFGFWRWRHIPDFWWVHHLSLLVTLPNTPLLL